MSIRLYLLIRLRRETQADVELPFNKFGRVLAAEFTKQYSETFSLKSTSIDVDWIRLRFESSIKESAIFTLYHQFQQIRSAVIDAQDSIDFPEAIDSISAVATVARLNWKQQDSYNEDEIPWWVPEEFRNTLLVDESLLKLLRPDVRKRFKRLSNLTLYQNKFDDDVIERSQRLAKKKLFAQFRNVTMDEKKAVIPPLKLTAPCKSIDELLDLANEAYKDVPESKGVGGRSLLISFCLERNSATDGRNAIIPNAAALGLTYDKDAEIIKEIMSGNLILERVVGRSSN